MSKNKKKGLGLSTTIFISLLVGALFGIVLHYVVPASDFKTNVIIEGVLYVCGQGFIRLMQGIRCRVPVPNLKSHKA